MHTLTSSTSEHIIVHFQIINDKNYIRILTTPKTQDYLKEIKIVYGQQVNLYDEGIHVFYNSGDLYDRLISDLGFKKFKGIEKINKIINGIWEIIPYKTYDILLWYNNTYLKWITERLNMYIEDLDDELYFTPWDIKWKNLEIKNHLKINYLENLYSINYELLNLECTKDGTYIFTRHHFIALLSQYIKHNYSKILDNSVLDLYLYNNTEKEKDKNQDEDEKQEKSTIIIKQCDYLRGLIINKNILNIKDIEEIFKILSLSSSELNIIAKCKEYIDIYENEISNQFNNISEMNIFGSNNYMFLENENNPICQGDIETVYEILLPQQKKPMFFNLEEVVIDNINLKMGINECESEFQNNLCQNVKIDKQILPIEYKKILFKNLLENTLNAYDEDIKLLKEIELLSTFAYKSSYTADIINSISEISLSKSLINELKELILILDNSVNNSDEEHEEVEDDQNKKKTPMTLQKLLTDSYIQQYKNDNAETIASTVVNNIYSYLSSSPGLGEETINKNQIGIDLVDLGVRKTRKAKGYVYGIEDSKHISEKKNYVSEKIVAKIGSSTFLLDELKVAKYNMQIRSEPSNALNLDSDLFRFSTPGKFLIPKK